jgi:hypothetical protein
MGRAAGVERFATAKHAGFGYTNEAEVAGKQPPLHCIKGGKKYLRD